MPEREEALWLTENLRFSLAELAELAGVPEAELRELADYGAITPVDPGASQWVFTATCLTTVRAASRLRALPFSPARVLEALPVAPCP